MSSTSESTSDLDSPPLSPSTSESFEYTITHVFFPAELPKENDWTIENNHSLADTVCAAALAYTPHVHGTSEEDLWRRITKMLDNLRASVQTEHLDKDLVISQLRGMGVGDIITFFIRFTTLARPEYAAIVVTRREGSTLFESFEVSPSQDAVEKAPGPLTSTYPWFAAEIPNEMFDSQGFQSELADFLSSTRTVYTYFYRGYVTGLFTGPLRGAHQTAGVTAIPKRIRDEVVKQASSVHAVWRRSPLWLLIRVAIQMSLEHSSVDRAFYKCFILYFICTLAMKELSSNLDNDLLLLISSKIFRRLTKLGPSAPDWLSKMALDTCARLREILDARWKELSIRPSPFRNPTEEELVRDTKLSLPKSGEYIRRVISTPDTVQPRPPFHPNHCPRHTLDDFLSLDRAGFDEACCADPEVTMYDVERSVEQEIDDWIAHVADVDDACARLDNLMDQYYEKLREDFMKDPEHDSVGILTLLELFIAIDKLAMQKIPMLADYSPGIPTEWLEQLCLRRTANFHRLSCACQHLVARDSLKSALSDCFTEDSFSVHYYDESTHLQGLKARIEQEIIVVDACQQADSESGVVATWGDYQEWPVQRGAQDARLLSLLLCGLPLHAKVVVFELQCPPCFRIWRSAIARIYHRIFGTKYQSQKILDTDYILLAKIPELQPYLLEQQLGPHHQRLVCSYSRGFYSLEASLHYGAYYSKDKHELWLLPCQKSEDFSMEYYRFGHYYLDDLSPNKCVDSTSYTSNDVLASQAGCPTDLSLDEFITFAHLRSGALLQWLNILCGLHSRTLTLRRDRVHLLLSHAVFQVGPLDPNTGAWIWHQDLQDPCFCNTFIDELDSLFVDGVGLIDGVFMSTISLLLARILASSPSARISERAIVLLRRVRRKMFSWVQELSYDVQTAPTNEERKTSLLLMALACRATFDVNCDIFSQLIRSAEDIDALLSCSFFIRVLDSGWITDDHFRILVARDSRMTLAIEEVARDAVLADPSNHGVDLAIARIFPSYYPGMLGLEALECPNSHWLTCRTDGTRSQPSKIVHINLLDGELQVDGQPCGRLPEGIGNYEDWFSIFGQDRYFVVPSNLPGMDLMVIPAVTPNYNVHISLRDTQLLVRAQCNQTNQVLELIPREILRQDLPPALVKGRVHWLNTSSQVVEIRPCGNCWEESVENWKIECTSGPYRVQKGCRAIVDIQSPTYAMLSACFSCLIASNLVVSVQENTPPVGSVQSTSGRQVTSAKSHTTDYHL